MAAGDRHAGFAKERSSGADRRLPVGMPAASWAFRSQVKVLGAISAAATRAAAACEIEFINQRPAMPGQSRSRRGTAEMTTGRIHKTTIEGGQIMLDDGSIVNFRWRESTLDPNGVGHGTKVGFYLIDQRRRATGVRLLGQN